MPRIKQTFLMTANLARSRAFYEEALELEPARVGETSVSYETGACELKIQADFDPSVLAEFNMSPPAERRGSGVVFALEVEDPLDRLHEALQERLASRAGEVLIEPRDVTWGGRMFLVRDPDGYVLELRSAQE